jgi:hypothetical protein
MRRSFRSYSLQCRTARRPPDGGTTRIGVENDEPPFAEFTNTHGWPHQQMERPYDATLLAHPVRSDATDASIGLRLPPQQLLQRAELRPAAILLRSGIAPRADPQPQSVIPAGYATGTAKGMNHRKRCFMPL